MGTESVNVLIAIHGHEPDGWTKEVPPALADNSNAVVRILVVDEPPPAPFTSLLPAARRRYVGAVRMWREIAAAIRRRSIDELVPRLPVRPEVVYVPCVRGDSGRTIVQHAAAWPVHIVVVGRDGRAGLSRGLVPPVHERVVREAPCAIIVAPAAPVSAVILRRSLAAGVSR
jgi:nucleotide-binding universal stress UspA family protein